MNRSRADKSAVVNSGGRLCAHTMPLCLYNFEARFVYLFSFDFRGISVVVSSTGKPCFRRGRRVRHFITMRICTLSARTTGGQHISSVNMDARGTNEQRQMGWFGDSVHFGWKQSYLRWPSTHFYHQWNIDGEERRCQGPHALSVRVSKQFLHDSKYSSTERAMWVCYITTETFSSSKCWKTNSPTSKFCSAFAWMVTLHDFVHFRKDYSYICISESKFLVHSRNTRVTLPQTSHSAYSKSPKHGFLSVASRNWFIFIVIQGLHFAKRYRISF